MESRGEWNLFRFQGLRPETEINFLSFFSPISWLSFKIRFSCKRKRIWLKFFYITQYRRRYSYTHMNTHSYEYTHVYLIPMSIFKRLDQFDLAIHEVG
jgi:hypothetical protein